MRSRPSIHAPGPVMRTTRTAASALRLALLALGGSLVATAASAQGPAPGAHASAPVAHATPLQGSISLDGRLNEPGWRAASAVTAFTQLDPEEGKPASERTEIYILYDADALYIGARMHDSRPVSSRLARRDAVVDDSDWLIVSLDSYHDHLTSFRFWVNPAGVRRDERFSSGGNRGGALAAGSGGMSGGSSVVERGGDADASWEPVWAASATVTDSGWVAEMRIPFGQLRFSREEVQTWGLQLERRIARRQEQAVFAFTPKNQPAGVALYGHLDGIQVRTAQKRLEVAPYASGRLLYQSAVAQNASVGFPNPFQSRGELSGGAGADVKYRLTTNFTLDATLNPDFGQVELDPAVVNLTAFETRFDEKRPFFVEGAEILRFGTQVQGNPEGGPPQLVYSRRIGRAPQLSVPGNQAYADLPETTTILGAAKLTGRTGGGWSFGVLEAVTQREEAAFVNAAGEHGTAVVEPLSNYLAARMRRDRDGGRATYGAILTGVNRQLSGGAERSPLRSSAYAGGIDFRRESSDRVWSIFGTASSSRIQGSTTAIAAAQRASARYLQRPDADHLDFDPDATSLSGYRVQVDGGKRAGNFIWNVSLTATSPGYEINDLGFQLNSDRILIDPNFNYEHTKPGRFFRRWSLRFGPDLDFNYGGDVTRNIPMFSVASQLSNYWTNTARFNLILPAFSDRLTRGGPLTRIPPGWLAGFTLGSDPRKDYTLSGGATYTKDNAGMHQTTANLNLGLKPASNWNVQAGPNLNTSYLPAQYVATIVDPTATSTYGSRYVFAGLRQTTLGIDTRLNVTFTSALSLELYAQPFFSTNDFGALKELRAPRTFDFLEYGRDVGTVTREEGARTRVDPDGDGAAGSFRVDDRDFNLASLRGNAVMRWEWRPGSTLFLVWQQNRSNRLGALDAERYGREVGGFDMGRNVQDLFDARPVNVLVFKMSYWLNP